MKNISYKKLYNLVRSHAEHYGYYWGAINEAITSVLGKYYANGQDSYVWVANESSKAHRHIIKSSLITPECFNIHKYFTNPKQNFGAHISNIKNVGDEFYLVKQEPIIPAEWMQKAGVLPANLPHPFADSHFGRIVSCDSHWANWGFRMSDLSSLGWDTEKLWTYVMSHKLGAADTYCFNNSHLGLPKGIWLDFGQFYVS